MSISVAVQLERNHALTDAQAIIDERGEDIILYYRKEVQITRDKYNSMVGASVPDTIKIEIKTFPVTFQPNKYQIERSGLREEVDVICKVGMKSLIDNSCTFEGIDLMRATVILRGITYVVKDKQLDSQFADTFLYVHLGLNRQ